MPALSCCVSTECELLKMLPIPDSFGKVYAVGALDRQNGIVNHQMLFICSMRSHDQCKKELQGQATNYSSKSNFTPPSQVLQNKM